MLVVSDTTPLNYLLLIGEQEILPALYEEILVPTVVIDELKREQAPKQVRAWANQPPNWVNVQVGDPTFFPLLDPGEAAALALAIQNHADALLADDAEARSAARAVGLVAIGSLGILAEAHRASLLDFEVAVTALKTTSFHVSSAAIELVRDRLRQ